MAADVANYFSKASSDFLRLKEDDALASLKDSSPAVYLQNIKTISYNGEEYQKHDELTEI